MGGGLNNYHTSFNRTLFIGSIGEEGSSPGKFREPRDIAIDCNGNVLVTDTGKHTLQIFDKDGTFIRVSLTVSIRGPLY